MKNQFLLGLLILSYLLPTQAGRPVFHEPTLEEIVASSTYVAVVALNKKIKEQKNSCEPQIIQLKVLELLKPQDNKQQNALAVNSVIDVINNQTSLQDCAYRKAHPGGSGVSFPANRYRGFALWTAKPKDQFIIFLNHQKGASPMLAMDGAMESLDKRSTILKLILKR